MRIGMILDKAFPPDPRVENEASTLINAGHKLYLFCLKYSSNLNDENINGLLVKRYASNKLEYKLSALAYTFPFYSKLMSKKIKHFLKKNKIDIIHIHDMRIAEAVFKVNNIKQLPVVLDLHDNMPEVMKFYPHLQKFPGKQIISPRKWKLKEEEFIAKADKVITVSQEFIDEVIDRTGILQNKIVLVPNTVKKSFYKEVNFEKEILKKYKNNFTILYVGDTGLRRGLLTAIDAIEILKEKIKNIKLLLVGKSSTDDVLNERVKALHLENYVDFLGWQDVSLFPSFIQASSICISPLERSAQHDVALANKLFQYMSFAKPVLVSDAIAQKKIVEKTKSGLIHKEKDASDFAKKVMVLYKDAALRKELGENGEKFIEEEYVWEKVSGNLVELYKSFERGK